MKSALAVLWRDLASAPRRNRFYLKRSALVVAGSVALLWGLWMARDGQTSTMGLVIFSSLSMSSLTALTIISVASACWAVIREKEDRTLGLLFLSDISCSGFVFGKMGTCLFSTTMIILSVLPLFMLGISLGGISMTQVLMAFALLLSTIYLGTGIGILSGCAYNDAKRANSFVAFLSVIWFVVVPLMVTAHMAVGGTHPSTQKIMTVISPFVAMGQLNYGNMIPYAALNALLSLALGSLCVVLANVILPHRVVSKERRSLMEATREKMRHNHKVRKWIIPPRIVGTNPVVWKDLNYYHGGMRSTLTKFIVSFSIVMVIAFLIGNHLNPHRPRDTFKLILSFEFAFCLAVFALGSISHFGMAFNRERRSRTLEVLLTSGLTDGEIVKGKIIAVLKSLSPWLICLLVCSLIMLVTFDLEYFFGEILLVFVLELVSTWFAYSAIALWMSLKFKRAIAFPTCILMFLLWNSFGRMITTSIMLVGADYKMVVAVDVIVHLIVGVTLLTKTRTSLRSIAAQSD